MNAFTHMAIAAGVAVTMSSAVAHGVQCGDISVAHPYSKPSPGMSKIGAVYFIGIKNGSKEADQLIRARTDVSPTIQIHEMVMVGDIMKMREVTQVELPPGVDVPLKQGQTSGHHLMLMDLKKPLKEGDKFPITLTFKRAGECRVEVWVEAAKADAHKH